MATTVYLVLSPTRQVVQVQAEIAMRKLGWAVVKGRRHLLGSTAFFTAAAAHRCKLALLVKRAKVSFLQWHYPMMMAIVREQLRDPKHPGWNIQVRK